MTQLLERAVEKLRTLPPQAQDAAARWIIDEIEAEQGWDEAFATSQNQLALLAAEALQEHRRGETRELIPEML